MHLFFAEFSKSLIFSCSCLYLLMLTYNNNKRNNNDENEYQDTLKLTVRTKISTND